MLERQLCTTTPGISLLPVSVGAPSVFLNTGALLAEFPTVNTCLLLPIREMRIERMHVLFPVPSYLEQPSRTLGNL